MQEKEVSIIDFLRSIESTLKSHSERLDKIMDSMGIENQKIDESIKIEEIDGKPLLTKESLEDLRERLLRIKDDLNPAPAPQSQAD